MPLEGDRKPWMVVPHATSSSSGQGYLSPDGRWLAYASNESGPSQVYVVAFRGGQGKWQVSTTVGIATAVEQGWQGAVLLQYHHAYGFCRAGERKQWCIAVRRCPSAGHESGELRGCGLRRVARRQENPSGHSFATGQPIRHCGYELYRVVEEVNKSSASKIPRQREHPRISEGLPASRSRGRSFHSDSRSPLFSNGELFRKTRVLVPPSGLGDADDVEDQE